MNEILLSFIITLFAGITTVLGIFPTYVSSKYQDKIICFSLSFSAGVMLTISLISLIPESLNYLSNYLSVSSVLIVFIFLNIGILLAQRVDKTISQRIEINNLYRLGIVSILALIFHNIPEGVTTFLMSSSDLKLGLSLAFAIALHNIPEGIAIAVPIYYSTFNRKNALFYTLIAGFSEFFGAIFAYFFLSQYLNSFLLAIILSMTSGIMIQISLLELLPNSLEYDGLETVFLGFILGCFVMLFGVFFFHI